MAYEINFLPSSNIDILKAEASLFEFSQNAAETFTYEIKRLTETLCDYPYKKEYSKL